MHIFYSPDLTTNMLDETESMHAVKVLRLKEGEEIEVVDGKGTWAKAVITVPHAKRCEFRITEKVVQAKPDFHIHIGIAPTKNIERIEWFLEKCTEIGIDEISFLQCQRSERRQVNMERIEKVVISAMKQSGKAWLPQLHDLSAFSTVIKKTTANDQLFIAHLADDNRVELKDSLKPAGRYFILIGPEGDFSPEEIKLALDQGFKPVMLGLSRLRTETAGLVACHTFQVMN